MRILLIEDDSLLAQGLVKRLHERGHVVDWFDTLKDARSVWSAVEYDVVILDWMLPDGDGCELLKDERQRGFRTPVILLTARDEIGDRIQGLDAGADDYLVKPFAVGELLARLRALNRRPGAIETDMLACGDLALERATHTVRVGERSVPLSPTEFSALECLIRIPGRIWPKTQLGEKIYTLESEWSDNAVETVIHRLRRKLDEAGAAVELKTLRGVGYLIETTQS